MKKFRLFFIWQAAKEEDWLNQMSAQGYHLIAVKGLRYSFTYAPRQTYIYRLDYLAHLTPREKADYCDLIAETGAEQVTQFQHWTYFRRSREAGNFVLYSDNHSRIEVQQRLRSTLLSILGCQLISSFALYLSLTSTPTLKYWLVGFLVAVFALLSVCLIQVQQQIDILRKKKED